MAIVANVQNGELIYNYTDNSKTGTTATGSELGYDQFLQLLCAEMTHQDPLEPTSNTEYVAQLATFSQLEATLSMTEIEKNNMANSLVGKQVILKVTSDTTGETSYIDGKVDYIMYQDGEVYLSVNDGLYPLDSLDTVADSQYYEAIAVSKTFEGMIGELPYLENLTTDWKAGLEQIRELYDGMSSYEQQFVSSEALVTLRQYEEKMNELVKAEEIANDENTEDGSEESSESVETV